MRISFDNWNTSMEIPAMIRNEFPSTCDSYDVDFMEDLFFHFESVQVKKNSGFNFFPEEEI